MKAKFTFETLSGFHKMYGDVLVIRDAGTGMTVTNDAEAVVAFLLEHKALCEGRRLLYFDSEGNLDEILHDGEKFTGFAPGPR